MRSLFRAIGRTGRPHAHVVYVLGSSGGRVPPALAPGRTGGPGFVLRQCLGIEDVARVLPGVAELMTAKLLPHQAYRVFADLGFATVELFDLNPTDWTFTFVRHVATVELGDWPVDMGEDEEEEPGAEGDEDDEP